jgi:hypothetical protein
VEEPLVAADDGLPHPANGVVVVGRQRDHPVIADEDADRLLVDLLVEGGLAGGQLRGLDQDERVVGELLGLGPDAVDDVLDGQPVEVEDLGDGVDLLAGGRLDPDPGGPAFGLGGRDVVVLGDAVGVVDDGVDGHVGSSIEGPMATSAMPTMTAVIENARPG